MAGIPAKEFWDKEENKQWFLADVEKRLKESGLYSERRMQFAQAFIEGRAAIGCHVDKEGKITDISLVEDE